MVGRRAAVGLAGIVPPAVLVPLLLLQAAAGQEAPTPAAAPAPPPAQAAAVAEPDYEGVFALIDPATGALSELERVEGEVKERRGGGLAMERYLQLAGGPSPVRVPAGRRPELVVRVPSQGKDPQALLALVAVEIQGRARLIRLAKVKLSGRVERLPMERLPIEVVKHGASSFKLWPAGPARPGEYCAVAAELTRFFFCFGVD